MKRFSLLAVLALALAPQGVAAQQTSAPNPLYDGWTIEDMRSSLLAAGHTVMEAQRQGDNLVIPVSVSNGLNYVVMGSGCAGEPARCRAANFLASVRTGQYNSVTAMGVVDYSMLAETPLSEDVLALSHYVLFDGGITRANLVANIQSFEATVVRAVNDLRAAPAAAPAQ